MGYTHYFGPTNISIDDFKIIAMYAQKCYEQSDIQIAFEFDEPSMPPVFALNLIRFNGIGNSGCETFVITPNQPWDFCKTRQRPYDGLVVAILCIVNHITHGSVNISSDGFAEDWQYGLGLARQATGIHDMALPPRIE